MLTNPKITIEMPSLFSEFLKRIFLFLVQWIKCTRKKLLLRIHWRLSTILKTSKKSVWRNVFRYVKVCIFWKCTQYTILWDKTHKFPLSKINGTKYVLFFLSRAPVHHNFTFNLQFLYEPKHKICLFKTTFGIFHFRLRFAFITAYVFVQQNAWALWF